MMICGIEEAGRGPVLGPMIMVGATIKKENEHLLKDLGVKDSKLLSRKERENLFKEIKSLVDNYKIIFLSPERIDDSLNNPLMNLNFLEAKTSAQIIIQLSPQRVILDCPSININAYTRKVKEFILKEGFLNNIQIISEHKADVNYPIVSAASIIAKVTRDKAMDLLKNILNIELGSGYPGDPRTKKFLRENFNNPKYKKIIRTTWSTYKKLVEEII